jgi:DNA-binding MarR family transcriptional regulator
VFSVYTVCGMNSGYHKIHGKFQSLMALALKLDQMPKQFGTGRDLSHTEIHLIEIIGDGKDLGVTDIARLIGVTKGAVSQALNRLEKKELVRKQEDPDNRSKLLISLTALGNMAYWAHKHWHETMDGGFIKYLEGLNTDQTGFLLDFLTRVEDFLQRRIDSPE